MFRFKRDKDKPRLRERLAKRLSRTRESLTEKLSRLALGRKVIDAELLEEIETQLLMADVGVEATQQIIEDLTSRVKRKALKDPEALFRALREDMLAILRPVSQPLEIPDHIRPFIILVVGVNGSGKTTTIGKLAWQLKQGGLKVMLAAGDTFRAAAIEQLKVWGERIGVPVVAQHTGADAASVIFDAVQAARARGIDVLIADTAGRLHTQANLMEELKKVKRVIQKLDPSAPHEVLLVIDATAGQNALMQAMQFHQAVGVTGIAITKLDGTAKGGIVLAIAKRLGLPIRFIGVGEGLEDLRPFDAEEFVDALLSREEA
ncbi:MAG: signal recognition particle-docking protein FtsY [Gammaproteobacteria bacterium]|nr:MAG: signal recognition particle-docking protein FtsY [Gammaproteobacteria bacterium]